MVNNLLDMRRILKVVVFAIFATAMVVKAAEPRFYLFQNAVHHPEFGDYTNWVVLNNNEKITLTPPHDCSISANAATRTVKIVLAGNKGTVSIAFTTNDAAMLQPQAQAGLTEWVYERFPSATISPPTGAFVGTGRGVAYKIDQVTTYKTRVTTELIFVPFNEQIMEISLVSGTQVFPSLRATMNGLLTSLRTETLKPETVSLHP